MEEVIYLNSLYDYYKELLTDKQKNYFIDYYQNNLTLSEIGENYNVSRNAVHRQLKETIKLLEDYEQKLNLKEKNDKIINVVKNTNDKKLMEKIERIIEG